VPFYRQLRWGKGARRAGLRFEVVAGGSEPGIAAAAEASAAAALADPQATWCACKAPAGGIRAVGRQGGDAWARAKLEVAGGGQERGTAPAAGRQKQSRGGRGARKKKGVRIELGTILQYQRKAGTSL
jgi:hypothetical protein